MKKNLMLAALLLLLGAAMAFAEEICTVNVIYQRGNAYVFIDYGQGKVEKVPFTSYKDIGISYTEIIKHMKDLGWSYDVKSQVLKTDYGVVLFFTR